VNDENLSSENGWHHQLKSRINNVEKLSKLISLSDSELKALGNSSRLKMSITPHFLSLIDKNNTNCPLRKQAIPTSQELNISEDDLSDPCGEERDMVVNGLVHRYPDRVLLLVTNLCAMYCRHCTRRRLTNKKETSLSQEHLDNAYSYIKKNKKIRDVLISGGDPLILSDEKIESILKSLRAIEHIEIIRIGTRIPVVLPQRITPQLVSTLKKYHPLYISIHFNHSKEISKETKIACEMLADAGIPLGSQTVLLKGINDNTKVMMNLMHELLKIRVRPYYMYQADLTAGTEHFRTKINKGLEIIRNIRGFTSGIAVPHYIIDAPGGGGKIPLLPKYLISKKGKKLRLKNYIGKEYEYIE